jgi:hypothetical protein
LDRVLCLAQEPLRFLKEDMARVQKFYFFLGAVKQRKSQLLFKLLNLFG